MEIIRQINSAIALHLLLPAFFIASSYSHPIVVIKDIYILGILWLYLSCTSHSVILSLCKAFDIRLLSPYPDLLPEGSVTSPDTNHSTDFGGRSQFPGFTGLIG